MVDNHIWWPTVTPVPFTTTDECYWLDGKPRCPKHHVVLVTTASINLAYLDLEGTHVCYRCMAEYNAPSMGADETMERWGEEYGS